MDLRTILYHLLLFCFDPSTATSLITGKTHSHHKNAAKIRLLDLSVDLFLLPHVLNI